MTLPFTLPVWLPWWVPTVILIPLLLYGLVFFLMPFSVMGVKGRLETLDARLDEIQGEIRALALRLPEPLRGGYVEQDYAAPLPVADPGPTRSAPMTSRPPIPPAPQEPYDERAESRMPGRRDPRGGRLQPGPGRAEPRLNWPQS